MLVRLEAQRDDEQALPADRVPKLPNCEKGSVLAGRRRQHPPSRYLGVVDRAVRMTRRMPDLMIPVAAGRRPRRVA